MWLIDECSEWQDIRPSVIEYFEQNVRPLRVVDEYHAFLEHCLPALQTAWSKFARAYGNVFPHLSDFTDLPEVRKLLDIESEEDIDVDFDSLAPAIPRIVSTWREKVHERLDKYIRLRLPGTISSKTLPQTQVSDLAVAHFLYCMDCYKLILNQDVMPAIHKCRKNTFYPRVCEDPYKQAMDRLGMKYWRPRRCSIIPMLIFPILRACGKDNLVTVQELDKLDPRLICGLEGCKLSDPHTVYHWRDAVSNDNIFRIEGPEH